MRHVFPEVRMKAFRYEVGADGKKRLRQKTIVHTINPFNRNAAGIPKSRDEVIADVRAEVLAYERGED